MRNLLKHLRQRLYYRKSSRDKSLMPPKVNIYGILISAVQALRKNDRRMGAMADKWVSDDFLVKCIQHFQLVQGDLIEKVTAATLNTAFTKQLSQVDSNSESNQTGIYRTRHNRRFYYKFSDNRDGHNLYADGSIEQEASEVEDKLTKELLNDRFTRKRSNTESITAIEPSTYSTRRRRFNLSTSNLKQMSSITPIAIITPTFSYWTSPEANYLFCPAEDDENVTTTLIKRVAL